VQSPETRKNGPSHLEIFIEGSQVEGVAAGSGGLLATKEPPTLERAGVTNTKSTSAPPNDSAKSHIPLPDPMGRKQMGGVFSWDFFDENPLVEPPSEPSRHGKKPAAPKIRRGSRRK